MKRTNYCGLLTEQDIGKEVLLYGWVHARRDHGGVIFVDLRDREGIIQIVFQPENKEIFSQAEKLRSEYVLRISGTVRRRPPGTENLEISTGTLEVVVKDLEIINTAPVLPFEISDYMETSEEIRLKYRFLDLRRPSIQKNFILRHKILQEVRRYFSNEGFLEIETPFLTKSTPEGARDFLVPSRLNPGTFYALPQSPQLFKQILMVSGFDRYFQIVRCFRDEDLRADRQPEFTQIDIEMSFTDENEIISIIENLIKNIFKNVLGKDILTPFPRISYDEAILKYGSDKPDTRFTMEIVDFSDELKNSNFKVFSNAINSGGVIRGLCVPKGAERFSRSHIDELIKYVSIFGAKGLAWMKVTAEGLESNIVKFFSLDEIQCIKNKFKSMPGDLILFLADNKNVVSEGLGALRLKIAKELNMIPKELFNFLWVVDFPLFEWDKEEKRWTSMHHPFTSPRDIDIPILEKDPSKVYARAYDIVLNGTELGGGSIRIHNRDIQSRIFNILNISPDEAKQKFGFLLDALSFGAPPHGGLAIGFDRLCALILGEESIRDVIAFPKTQKASCLLTGAPDVVSEKQIRELGIKILDKKI